MEQVTLRQRQPSQVSMVCMTWAVMFGSGLPQKEMVATLLAVLRGGMAQKDSKNLMWNQNLQILPLSILVFGV